MGEGGTNASPSCTRKPIPIITKRAAVATAARKWRKWCRREGGEETWGVAIAIIVIGNS